MKKLAIVITLLASLSGFISAETPAEILNPKTGRWEASEDLSGKYNRTQGFIRVYYGRNNIVNSPDGIFAELEVPLWRNVGTKDIRIQPGRPSVQIGMLGPWNIKPEAIIDYERNRKAVPVEAYVKNDSKSRDYLLRLSKTQAQAARIGGQSFVTFPFKVNGQKARLKMIRETIVSTVETPHMYPPASASPQMGPLQTASLAVNQENLLQSLMEKSAYQEFDAKIAPLDPYDGSKSVLSKITLLSDAPKSQPHYAPGVPLPPQAANKMFRDMYIEINQGKHNVRAQATFEYAAMALKNLRDFDPPMRLFKAAYSLNSVSPSLNEALSPHHSWPATLSPQIHQALGAALKRFHIRLR